MEGKRGVTTVESRILQIADIESRRNGHAVASRHDEDLSDYVQPIDWDELWSTDIPDNEWLIEPIVPAGRQVAMYSKAKAGKSLLAFDAVLAAATRRPIFGQSPAEPFDVVYIDQEQTEQDLLERLEAFGYGPSDDLKRLHYYLLTSLPPLNTDLGGKVVEAIVRRFDAKLVVLDTMTRMVTGKENENDPIRDFYRFTGMRLKSLGCALWRLDHAGKDPTVGQRGGSEKSGDVDVVFELSAVDDEVTLKRTHSRVPWVPKNVRFERQQEPKLAHLLGALDSSPRVLEVIRDLTYAGVPVECTVDEACNALKRSVGGRRRSDVSTAVKIRKARANEGS